VRITNRIILDRSLTSIGKGLEDMARLERQIVTGNRFQSLSEAGLEGRAVLSIDSDLLAAGQYTRNIEAARSRLAVSDATLDTVTNILGRARELAIQQGGVPANAATRAAARQEVLELRDAVIQLANRKLNGAYVFGGTYADRAPLDASGALDPAFPARGAPDYEIGPGVFTAAAHDAGEMFVDSDVMGALDALDAALAANDGPAIQVAGDRLRDAVSGVQNLVAEVGARQLRLDMAQEGQEIVSEGLRARRSTLADTVFEEAVTRLASRHSLYQASLLSTSRLMESTLVNYLR
jgi:flagellar hook-associated protein 3 FlgL